MTKPKVRTEPDWTDTMTERRKAGILRHGWRVSLNLDKRGKPTPTAMEARNLLHLLDLKMAGHSPSRTELNVPSGR